MSRPVPFPGRPVRTLWLDVRTGAGVADDGRPVRGVVPGDTRPVRTVELLDQAGAHGALRVYLCGGRPEDGWLLEHTPGWQPSPAGHYLDSDDPRGSWVSPAGATVQLRRAAPWYGPDASPRLARDAHALLEHLLPLVFRDRYAVLRDSPGATGLQLWALSAPAEWDGAQLDDDTAGLIRATSPQHRIEAMAGCYAGCDEHWRPRGATVDQAHYLDGRIMYAALLRELAPAPAVRLTGAQAAELYDADEYARARYRVRFTVPDGWEAPGVLLTRHPDGRHWHAPSRPGVAGETWADSSEVRVALGAGWPVEFLEAVQFTGTGRPLDTWRDRLLRLRERIAAADAEPALRDAARGAVRAMLLSAIGSMHSTGRDATVHVAGPIEVPTELAGTRELYPDGTASYRVRHRLTGQAAAYMHPELSSQIWGRAHARMLHHKGAGGVSGALTLPGEQVLGMWGDALYLSRDPGWPDDGRPGRLRSKGRTSGRIKRPATIADLNRLRERIERET